LNDVLQNKSCSHSFAEVAYLESTQCSFFGVVSDIDIDYVYWWIWLCFSFMKIYEREYYG